MAIDFDRIVKLYYSQGIIAFGKVENPANNTIEKDLRQAQFMIDVLEVLQEKTKGNLNEEEEQNLKDALENLRMLAEEEAGKEKSEES
ncbi:MAG: DUF1844 domain-containing protein [Candidatus Kapaibacterium sp.]